MPGSTVTTLPARSSSSERLRQPWCLVDLDADAVPEPVAEVLALARPDRSPRAPRSRPRARPRPARTACSAGELGLEHELVDRARVLGRGSRSPPCACSPSSSRRAPRPSRSRPARRARSATSRGWAWGSAPCGPAATIVSKLTAAGRRAGACRAPARSPARARCAPPAHLEAAARTRRRRARWRPGSASTSSGSLTARSRSTRPVTPTSSTRAGSSSRSRACWRTDVWASSKPSRSSPSGQRVGERVEQLECGPAALERGVDLLGGLLDVAKVGDERPRRRPDQRESVAAAVAGQIADVDQVGDQHHVDPGVRRAARARRSARAVISPAPRAAARARRGSRPDPCRRPGRCTRRGPPTCVATPRGASTSERWTSTAGSPVSSSASRIAQA